MLPPVLEVYVVWHPGDTAGAAAAEQFVRHFHGTPFSGLIGGAVEVYIRSEGWCSVEDAPRSIPFPGAPPLNSIPQAQIMAVVPVLGNEFAAAVQPSRGAWHDFALQIIEAQAASPDRVGVYPLLVDPGAASGTELGRLFSRFQYIASPAYGFADESEEDVRCRDLAQGIAQLTAGDRQPRLTIFISHTKHAAHGEEIDIPELIARVRSIIGQTRLNDFFDASDLQPGQYWDEQIRAHAANSALLALRTDLYASREWCQREMLIAKREGMPIVILDALGRGEERGSFLMDHVPRVPVRHQGGRWRDADIRLCLNLLVDECLKRALWRRQIELAQGRTELEIAWWAPHAPEPVTLIQWLETERAAGRLRGYQKLRVLHPDPPLGSEEKSVLDQIVKLANLAGNLDVMTPRLLAARGG